MAMSVSILMYAPRHATMMLFGVSNPKQTRLIGSRYSLDTGAAKAILLLALRCSQASIQIL